MNNCFTLARLSFKVKLRMKESSQRTINLMTTTNIYVNDAVEEGYVDTRSWNFECEEPDENLGCDLRIDVAG
jgi:hypothetical protein